MTDRTPVFVFGALRSGTTMFRLMLDSHSLISNPGEVDFLFDHLEPDATHPTGWRYDRNALARGRIFRAHGLVLAPALDGLDLLADMIAQFQNREPKAVLTMNVHRNARRIAEIIPDARFIHMLRDPRDVARSCIGMGWCGNSYYGASIWIDSERDWDRAEGILPPAHILTLRFEHLLHALKPQLAEVCGFLGVALEPDMLEFHRNSTYDPPDPTIVQQWRRKARRREVALIEGRCGELMQSRDYRLEVGAHHPARIERIALAVDNRTKRWRHNIDRFGLGLFLAGHITRLPGLAPLHWKVKRRMESKIVARLR